MNISRKLLRYHIIFVLALMLLSISGCESSPSKYSNTNSKETLDSTETTKASDASISIAEESTTNSDIINPTVAYVFGLNDYYNVIENNINNIPNSYISEKIDFDFIEWINNEYNKNFSKKLADALKNNSYTDSFWFDNTNCSFHVLWDLYTNAYYTSNNIIKLDSANKDVTSISFAGDLCLSENWYTLNKYDSENQNLSACISKDLIDKLNSSDIFMLNNEFTFSDRGSPLAGKYYTFRAATNRINILKDLGVDTVALANNHIYDFGGDAFTDTINTLTSNGITHFGGGNNIDEAKRPVYYIINGIKIGFVGATRAEKIHYTPGATSNSSGVLLTYDDTEYLNVIRNAKKYCDYLVAYVHWGTEDSHTVTDYQRTMGKDFIDAGADIVVGGHPHVLQGIEYYNGKPILYSLGDFWFNYETKETGVIEITLDRSSLSSMKFLPCMQDNFTTTLKNEPTESRRIFDFLQNLSFNANIDDNGLVTEIK